ncbi:MAG: hypothetical protein COT71_03595 [Candidatus Andersenbacteria bacterium CG10_big_fil_rev_8_21_14_0_10_54_11]|uniref:Phage holin family protein n=1 Tax=Candidatus Andersenbacteria bacterium CG10_big_fil_rev_8_21_14_0_10_54_11 TaxID=1974485 RepID=A0A2M6WYP6_9BACT|nr:MAG: hypothetical protein COT71_03595 [Candidatus Andersenbacteria bacterium CG10_big_fil_rev_8_21_14_0_10_54_11]
MHATIRLLVITMAVFAAAYILPGVSVSGFTTALVTGIILGASNMFVRPLLVVLTLPLTILTFGLFIGVINALLVLMVAAVVPGFVVVNFWWALLFSLVVSFISTFLYRLERLQRMG